MQIEIHKALQQLHPEGLVELLGEANDGSSDWLVTPSRGQPLTEWHGEDPAELVCIIQQVITCMTAVMMFRASTGHVGMEMIQLGLSASCNR